MNTVFGKDKEGNIVKAYTLENDAISFTVLDYGATLMKFIDKVSGRDIVLGFDDMDGYLNQNGAYLGASIGRCANRIAKGQFILNGKSYSIPINNNGNSLHGGLIGFDQYIFDAEEKEDCIIFSRISKDGEEGYPGNLSVQIMYRLLDHGIEIKTKAQTDIDTIFGYTNHSYFNLSDESILNHSLQIYGKQYAWCDENGLAKESLEDVAGTPFDYQNEHCIKDKLDWTFPQIASQKGYDHYYQIDGEGMRKMASLQYDNMKLTMSSDYPGMHLYTANYLNEEKGKYGRRYHPQDAICFEAEYHPNAINYDTVKEKPIVKNGEIQSHTIRFEIEHLI